MRNVLPLTILSVALVLSACSSSDNSTVQPSSTAPGTSGHTVNVTLREWEIAPDVKNAQAGQITFNVENKGPKEEHEFVILKTSLAPDKLPALADGSADEKGSGVTDVGEVEGIGAGAKSTGTFQLGPGTYVFICNVVEQDEELGQVAHYVQGMRTAFTVQ